MPNLGRFKYQAIAITQLTRQITRNISLNTVTDNSVELNDR